VRIEDEIRGLDLTEMGMEGYYTDDKGDPPFGGRPPLLEDGATSHYDPPTFSGLTATSRR
jgi:hypothetical protein